MDPCLWWRHSYHLCHFSLWVWDFFFSFEKQTNKKKTILVVAFPFSSSWRFRFLFLSLCSRIVLICIASSHLFLSLFLHLSALLFSLIKYVHEDLTRSSWKTRRRIECKNPWISLMRFVIIVSLLRLRLLFSLTKLTCLSVRWWMVQILVNISPSTRVSSSPPPFRSLFFSFSHSRRVDIHCTRDAPVLEYGGTPSFLRRFRIIVFELMWVRVIVLRFLIFFIGGCDIEAGKQFIEQLFLNRDRKGSSKRKIYTYFTCATDSRNVETVFNTTKDIILRRALDDANLGY